MSEGFPRVVCHHGLVDADSSIIAINTKDQCVSRGHKLVTYGHGRTKGSKSFLVAKLLLLAAPRFVSSRDILIAAYGAEEALWPADRHNAVARPLSDLRHRACPRLGLFVNRSGQSNFRLELLPPGTKLEDAHQERRVAQGRAKAGRPGLRSFGLELDEAEAATVRRFAIRENVSFAEAVRTLMQWGLDSYDKEKRAA